MKTGFRAVLTALVIGAAMGTAAASASAGTLDQQQTAAYGNAPVDNTASRAQSFTSGLTGGLDQLDLNLSHSSSGSAALTVEIRNVSGGVPGTQVLAGVSVPPSAVPIPSANAFVPVSFASPAPVVAGTQYAIVLYSAASANPYNWYGSAGNPYAAGAGFFSDFSPPTTWSAMGANLDFAFKTYVVSPAVVPPAAAPPPANTGKRAAALAKCKHKHGKKKRRRCRRRANRLPV